MQHRVVLPRNLLAAVKLPAVYLLHGGGADFRSWTNDSDVANFAEQGFVLVMPEGKSSYYVNAEARPQDRYEDYIVKDLIIDAESRLPIASGREHRAIMGISMGGFGAINLSMKHPDLFVFAAALSPALDVPSRPFSIKRMGQWHEHSSIFGAWGSQTRRENDPYLLAKSVDPAQVAYLFLTCGEQEGLLSANRKFAAELAQNHFRFEFHTVPGGHDWNQWNRRLPDVFRALSAIIRPPASSAVGGKMELSDPVLRRTWECSAQTTKARFSRSGLLLIREHYEPFWHMVRVSPRNVNSLLTEVLGGAPK